MSFRTSSRDGFGPEGGAPMFRQLPAFAPLLGLGVGLTCAAVALAAPATTLLSVKAAGGDSGNDGSAVPMLSVNDRAVLFDSYATNLVAIADGNNVTDLFVRDLKTGTTSLVTINAA